MQSAYNTIKYTCTCGLGGYFEVIMARKRRDRKKFVSRKLLNAYKQFAPNEHTSQGV